MFETSVIPIYTDELTDIVNIVNRNRIGGLPQHILICGEAGSGKSTFLQSLSNRLRGEGKKIVMFSFPYSSVTAANDITRRIPESERQMTILLVDDFHLLLNNLKIDEQYRLRSYLFQNGAPTMIATSQGQPPEFTDYRAPFFDAFRLFFLQPELYMQTFFAQESYEQLSQLPGWEEAKSLIADNLYYVKAFAAYYADKPSIQQTIGRLIADNERFFKQRFLSLSSVQQTILIGMAEKQGLSTLADIRSAINIDSTGITSALKRLAGLSFIRQIGQKKRSYTYIMTDKLFQEWLRRISHLNL